MREGKYEQTNLQKKSVVHSTTKQNSYIFQYGEWKFIQGKKFINGKKNPNPPSSSL